MSDLFHVFELPNNVNIKKLQKLSTWFRCIAVILRTTTAHFCTVAVEDGIDPFAEYKNLAKKDWHDHELMKKDQERTGPGERGEPVVLPKDAETKKRQAGFFFLR